MRTGSAPAKHCAPSTTTTLVPAGTPLDVCAGIPDNAPPCALRSGNARPSIAFRSNPRRAAVCGCSTTLTVDASAPVRATSASSRSRAISVRCRGPGRDRGYAAEQSARATTERHRVDGERSGLQQQRFKAPDACALSDKVQVLERHDQQRPMFNASARTASGARSRHRNGAPFGDIRRSWKRDDAGQVRGERRNSRVDLEQCRVRFDRLGKFNKASSTAAVSAPYCPEPVPWAGISPALVMGAAKWRITRSS